MKALPRIATAEPVICGVLKLVFTDGYEGGVDLRPLISQGRVFGWLQRPKNFLKVELGDYGHHVFWIDDKRSTSAPTACGAMPKNGPNSTN
jgi:hypothetical protein